MCKIAGVDVVNCRAGPGTDYKVLHTFKMGISPIFSCVKSGECITVNGAVNWSVPTPFPRLGYGLKPNNQVLTALASSQRVGLLTS
jgi:hypothetical protein